MRRTLTLTLALALVSLGAAPAAAPPDRGAAALAQVIAGLGVSARVLVIAAHPDDEDTQLITWLSLGRHVDVAYLALTRGDGGQNLIGDEVGEQLGVIRTEELLAARRIDGAEQFFTRAFDFGFSKTADETFQHWTRDSVLYDVVRVVRAFKPHVIVAFFTGTPSDGHGHHQVSGILAREAYDLAGDTVRIPRSATNGEGGWTPLKFYRRGGGGGGGAGGAGAAAGAPAGGRAGGGGAAPAGAGAPAAGGGRAGGAAPAGGALSFNVGEFSPILGRSYGEIAGESRSQHKSQGFGSTAQPLGARAGGVRLEATRVGPAAPAANESFFAGLDTALTRLSREAPCVEARTAVDSASAAIRDVQRTYNAFNPDLIVPRLAAAWNRIAAARCAVGSGAAGCTPAPPRTCAAPPSDLVISLERTADRLREALLLASGTAIEATSDRDVAAIGDAIPVTTTVYNRGKRPLTVYTDEAGTPARAIAVDSAFMWRAMRTIVADPRGDYKAAMEPWWLDTPERGGMFTVPIPTWPEGRQPDITAVHLTLDIAGARVPVIAPIIFPQRNATKGDLSRPLAIAPAVSVTLDQAVEFAVAGSPFDRPLRVHLQSARRDSIQVAVRLTLPAGITADSAVRRVTVGPAGIATVDFRIRGTLPVGRVAVRVVAEANGATFDNGYTLLAYDHIKPRRIYRDAVAQIEAVDSRVPPGVTVAYVPGAQDYMAPLLEQLGFPVTVIQPENLATADLSRFGAVVLGPRIFDVFPAVAGRLLDYARSGGTLVEQYQHQGALRANEAPYPMTVQNSNGSGRVTMENAPVRILEPRSSVLDWPNRITLDDFNGWVQERGTYMPESFDPRYTPVVSSNDPGDPPNSGGILVAPVGQGTFVYATLVFFRELPAGNPGAARLFVNLIGAGVPPARRAATPAVPLRP